MKVKHLVELLTKIPQETILVWYNKDLDSYLEFKEINYFDDEFPELYIDLINNTGRK